MKMVICLQISTITFLSDDRQTEIPTAEPLAPEVKIAITKLKSYTWPCSEQIPAELIQAGSEILLSKIHKQVNSIWNKEELPVQWRECIIVPVHKKGDKTDCSNYRGSSVWVWT
jgi:hypothetical protein